MLNNSKLQALFLKYVTKAMIMGGDEFREGISDRLVKKHYDEAIAAENEFNEAINKLIESHKDLHWHMKHICLPRMIGDEKMIVEKCLVATKMD